MVERFGDQCITIQPVFHGRRVWYTGCRTVDMGEPPAIVIALRDYEERDILPIVSLLNNARVIKWLSPRIPYPYGLPDAEWWVATGCREGINKAIDYQGELVGAIGVTPGRFEHARSAEIGYWVGEPHWGKGLATEAVAAMTTGVFRTTNIVRICGTIFSENTASMRVLEKCGYYREAVQKNALWKYRKLSDAHIYAIHRDPDVDTAPDRKGDNHG